jgi:hypothetical protein
VRPSAQPRHQATVKTDFHEDSRLTFRRLPVEVARNFAGERVSQGLRTARKNLPRTGLASRCTASAWDLYPSSITLLTSAWRTCSSDTSPRTKLTHDSARPHQNPTRRTGHSRCNTKLPAHTTGDMPNSKSGSRTTLDLRIPSRAHRANDGRPEPCLGAWGRSRVRGPAWSPDLAAGAAGGRPEYRPQPAP